jgi:uncharacterized protein YggE
MQNQFALNRNTLRFTTVVALAALLVGVLAFSTRPVGAQEPSDTTKTISVSGSGEVFGKPDVAYVTLGVDQADKDAGKAIDTANTKLTAIVKAIGDVGVKDEDIQTTSYNIYPEDPTDPQTGQPTGDRIFHVQLAVTVTIRDITKVGAVIQAGLGAGANDLNSLSFGIADTKSLEADARKAAVADAHDRAAQLAEAAGVTLGTPISISESVGNVPVPQFNRVNAPMALAASAAAPQINGGQLSVDITVNITYSIGG